MSLAGKTVLITGGAGSIGRAIATRFVAEGCRVVAVDVSGERLDALAADLPGIVTVVADLSTAAGADAAIAAAGGDIDILSVNAGISDRGAALDEQDDETWDRVLSVHLTSAFLISRRAVKSMLAKKAGVILLMSSVAGLRGGRTGIAYTSAKWALVGMAQNIAASLGPEGIRAYAICPGNIVGATTAAGVTFTPRALKNRGRDSQKPPPGTAADVANLAVFLAGDEARHINGVAIPIDNGQLAF
jgi:NAD(P)-dependent dehydrogenase (short-subunit alcohol dehydrogenase family)